MTVCIFVPGVKGTELYEGENKRWFPSTQKDLESLKSIKALKPTNVLNEVNAFFLFKESLYSGIIEEFGSDPDFVPYPYDWRNSILDEADNLVRFVISVADEKNTDIILVAHSMGGMLSKLAILKIQELGRVDVIKKLVTVGTPWKGAPDAFKVLEYGEPGFYSSLVNFHQIFDDKKTRSLARRLPSAYQLLPSKEYFDSEFGKFIIGAERDYVNYYDIKSKIQKIYNEENKEKEEDRVVDVWVKYIDPVHSAMKQGLPVEHDCLIGVNNPTFYMIPEGKYKTYRLFKATGKVRNGDGVVPFFSALPLHDANVYYAESLHRNQCSNKDVINFIKWSIGDKVDSCPPKVGQLQLDDFDNRRLIEQAELKKGVLTYILCPVETTIVDEEQKYVAGVIDPSLSKYRELSNSEDLQYLQMGEAKYLFTKKREDFNFEIKAYEEGIAEVGVEVFDEEESFGLQFNTITVNPRKKATLTVHNKSVDSEVKAELYFEQRNIQPKKKKLLTEEEKKDKPIPTIKIKAIPSDNSKKAPHRSVFSGAIRLSIITSMTEEIEELLYSVDGKVVGSIVDNQLLSLESGEYEIQVFGKDILGRAIKSNVLKVNIDKERPFTKLNLDVTPEGGVISFNTITQKSKVDTFYKFTLNDKFGTVSDSVTEWQEIKEDAKDKSVTVPNEIWRKLRENRNAYVTLEYYSKNEFGVEEEVKSFDFSIRDLPALMWTETASVTTAKAIFKNVTAGMLEVLEEGYEVQQTIQKKVSDLDPTAKVPDNVKSVVFSTSAVTIRVFFAEKYSLYFSGPPTELLEIGQTYTFSFELITERSGEKVVTTEPVAKLKPMKNGFNAQEISLKQKNGVFYGRFAVDELFRQYKHKLIITDNKNISPPLRESTLILKNDEEDEI